MVRKGIDLFISHIHNIIPDYYVIIQKKKIWKADTKGGIFHYLTPESSMCQYLTTINGHMARKTSPTAKSSTSMSTIDASTAKSSQIQ